MHVKATVCAVVVACVAPPAGAATTLVDLAPPSGAVRFLDVRPDVSTATILVLPAPGESFGVQADGSTTGASAACDPIVRNRDFLAARGLTVAIADQAYPNAAPIVDWLAARDGATVWAAGAGASASALANLANAVAPARDLGIVFVSPASVVPTLAASVTRPSLVVYHAQDPASHGAELLANLTSAPAREGVALSGGSAAGCGYARFEQLDVAFVNALAAFVNGLSESEAPTVPAVEYFNAGFGHYFMSADADEVAGLDGGAFGGAFVRTGKSFKVHDAPAAGTVPVCRFFTTPGTFGTKSSHFYTANPVECAGLKLNPAWIYEKIAFHVAVPSGGACAAGTAPVYRAYNHGQTGAPNHRFTTDLAVYQDFVANRGWDAEGIAFCAPL